MIDIEAIIDKYGYKEGLVIKDGTVTDWPYERKKPSKKALKKITLEYHAEINYKHKRANEYPSVEEQLDMLYHDMKDGTTVWVDKITGIKNKHPNPNVLVTGEK